MTGREIGARVHLGQAAGHPTDERRKEETRMSEHQDAPKGHTAHAVHEDHAVKGPHNPKEINPKMSSDIAYWSKEFGVSGDKLHELIRSHGTHVDKVRAAV